MSNSPHNDRRKELRDWANLIGTYAMPLLLAWVVWSWQSKFSMQRMEMSAEVDKKLSELQHAYVSKSWFEACQQETNKRLDGIAGDMSRVQQDVATIRGQLQVRRPPP